MLGSSWRLASAATASLALVAMVVAGASGTVTLNDSALDNARRSRWLRG
jgi:hypothetical protein